MAQQLFDEWPNIGPLLAIPKNVLVKWSSYCIFSWSRWTWEILIPPATYVTHSEHFGYIFHLKMLNEIFMAHYSEYFNYYKYGSVSLWKLSYFLKNWFDFETRDATKFVPQNFFIDISRAFLEDILETFSMTLLRICLIFSCDLF